MSWVTLFCLAPVHFPAWIWASHCVVTPKPGQNSFSQWDKIVNPGGQLIQESSCIRTFLVARLLHSPTVVRLLQRSWENWVQEWLAEMHGLIVTDAKKWDEAIMSHHKWQQASCTSLTAHQWDSVSIRSRLSTRVCHGQCTHWIWRWGVNSTNFPCVQWVPGFLQHEWLCFPDVPKRLRFLLQLLVFGFCQAVSLSKEGSTAKGIAEKLSTMPCCPKWAHPGSSSGSRSKTRRC